MAFLSRSGYQHVYYRDLHERYGSVVRIGPNELSIREPSAVMALIGPSGLPKGPHVTGRLLTDKDLPMIGMEDMSAHLTRRRAWNRGFSSAAIAEYEDLVGRRAMQLVQRLEEHQGKQVDLERWFDYFSYDAMCDMTNETLRVYTPGLGGSQRKVPADSPGVTVGSLYIPPGTAFWVHAFSLHRDPNNFSPFPDDFWPDRWLLASHSSDPLSPYLGDAKPTDFVHNEEAYMPFSHGPMNCVGKNFALMEMRIVVCALVQRFRFRLREGYDPADYDRNFKDYLIASRPNLPVVVELR